MASIAVLQVLSTWLREVHGDSIHVDLADWPSPATLIANGRPDIAIKTKSNSICAIE
jgi:hypothetical protein